MPANSPWIDTWAPPQWIIGSGANVPPNAAAGQASTTLQDLGGVVGVNTAGSNAVDTTLHWKVSGTIILALIIIFGIKAMGFRFVTSANASIG